MLLFSFFLSSLLSFSSPLSLFFLSPPRAFRSHSFCLHPQLIHPFAARRLSPPLEPNQLRPMSQKVEGDYEPLHFFLQRELSSGFQKTTSSLWTEFQIHNGHILNLHSTSQFTEISTPPPHLYSKPFYWLFLSEELQKSIIVFISVLGMRKLELKYRVKIKVLLNLLT